MYGSLQITDVTRETTGGFDRGRVTVEGLGEHVGTSLFCVIPE